MGRPSETLRVALALIVFLVVWNRNRIAEKNRMIYRQIMKQDRLAEKFKQLPALDENNKVAVRIHEYLLRDRNFANPKMNIEKIAEDMNVSFSYLYQAIREIDGDDKPQDYINNVRLDEARRLLSTTNELIENIAKECGYLNATTIQKQKQHHACGVQENVQRGEWWLASGGNWGDF